MLIFKILILGIKLTWTNLKHDCTKLMISTPKEIKSPFCVHYG